MFDTQLGRRMGQFVLEEQLDPDGGPAYRGISIEQRRSVAVKLLPKDLASSDVRVDQFTRELQFLRTLRHPHIATCYGGGVHEGDPYLVLELIRGESSAQLLRRTGRIPWQQAVQLASQACDALEYAHQRNVFHGELTPEKVLIDENGEVKLVGFRAEGRADRECPRDRTEERKGRLESAAYLAPEQFCGRPVTSRTDLYSVGCILFEWLTGSPPFQANNPMQLAQKHLGELPPRVSLVVADCPVWLDALVARLLEKQPDRRPPFASAVILALNETMDKVASSASVVEHAASGLPSTLASTAPMAEARKALGIQPVRRHSGLLKKVALPVGALLLIAAAFTWALWPASEAQLFQRAAAIMTAGDDSQWEAASRNYLEPLLQRFPNGKHASQAQVWLDQIEADRAQRRLEWHASLERSATSAAEERFLQAQRFEKFGDLATALVRYDALGKEFQSHDDDRPFAALARVTAKRIRATGKIETTESFLARKLAAADKAMMQGKSETASRIWKEILSLYSGNKIAEPFRQQAEARLQS